MMVASVLGLVFLINQITTKQNIPDIEEVSKMQYDLALEEIGFGRYEIARQRLIYIQQLNPKFDVDDILDEVENELKITPNP